MKTIYEKSRNILVVEEADVCVVGGSCTGVFAAVSAGLTLEVIERYEQCGIVPNVGFSCGAIADYDKDRIRVYYGGADTCIGLATGSLSELIDACLRGL